MVREKIDRERTSSASRDAQIQNRTTTTTPGERRLKKKSTAQREREKENLFYITLARPAAFALMFTILAFEKTVGR
jgi:uncharacterized protein YjbK